MNKYTSHVVTIDVPGHEVAIVVALGITPPVPATHLQPGEPAEIDFSCFEDAREGDPISTEEMGAILKAAGLSWDWLESECLHAVEVQADYDRDYDGPPDSGYDAWRERDWA